MSRRWSKMKSDLKNEEKLLKELVSNYNVKGRIQRERRIWINTDKEKLISICKFVKEKGFDHLSAISVTDWLKEGEYEITYHLWSYKRKILLTIKIRVSRKNPSAPSVSAIWDRNAQIHEREMHEMFGVEFKGNDDLAPLFLENWQNSPPFRKDFDWREYVKKECYNKDNEREIVYHE